MPTPKLFDTQSQLAAVEAMRTRLFGLAVPAKYSVTDLIHAFWAALNDLLEFRSASVFLLNKRGHLERSFIEGQGTIRHSESPSPDGRKLLDSLLVGKPLSSPPGSSATLSCDWALEQPYAGDEVELAPLNGPNTSFGLVELVCSGDAKTETKRAGQVFLHASSSALAGAITLLRARSELLSLAEAPRLLLEAETQKAGAGFVNAFEALLGKIVEGSQDFRAGILRTISSGDILETQAKAGDPDIVWSTWRDVGLRAGQLLAGKVVESGLAIAVADIGNDVHAQTLFKNHEWLEINRLRSCICCPLLANGEVVGTLALYCGFVNAFSELDVARAQAFADRFASFWGNYRISLEKEKVAVQLADERDRAQQRKLWEARASGINATELHYLAVIHETKTLLGDVLIKFKQLLAVNNAKYDHAIREVISRLQPHQSVLERELKYPLNPRNRTLTDVNALIRNLAKDKQTELNQAGIGLELELAALPMVKVVRTEFADIVDNLLTNAIRAVKASRREPGRVDPGKIVVSTSIVQLSQKEGLEKTLEISVWDNGTGISPSVQESMFKAGSTTGSSIGGTGFGLYFVKSFVDEYQGSIDFETEEGVGTQFRIQIPFWMLSVPPSASGTTSAT